MKKIILLYILVNSSFASEAHYNCFPENNLRIPVSKITKSIKKSGLSELQYHSILDAFESVWSPIIESKYKKQLVIKREWENSKVNAHATRDDIDNPVLVINGGLARHKNMNRDGLLLILCHELGHQFGGAPKAFRGRSERRSWSSAEGQADYFATNKCMPKLIEKDILNSVSMGIKDVNGYCQSFNCNRILSGAMSVGKLFASLRRDWQEPSLEGKSKIIVNSTNHKHPTPQCRLDTFIAGSNCNAGLDIDFDNVDYKIGSCLRDIDPGAARPSCWFSSNMY